METHLLYGLAKEMSSCSCLILLNCVMLPSSVTNVYFNQLSIELKLWECFAKLFQNTSIMQLNTFNLTSIPAAQS